MSYTSNSYTFQSRFDPSHPQRIAHQSNTIRTQTQDQGPLPDRRAGRLTCNYGYISFNTATHEPRFLRRRPSNPALMYMSDSLNHADITSLRPAFGPGSVQKDRRKTSPSLTKPHGKKDFQAFKKRIYLLFSKMGRAPSALQMIKIILILWRLYCTVLRA